MNSTDSGLFDDPVTTGPPFAVPEVCLDVPISSCRARWHIGDMTGASQAFFHMPPPCPFDPLRNLLALAEARLLRLVAHETLRRQVALPRPRTFSSSCDGPPRFDDGAGAFCAEGPASPAKARAIPESRPQALSGDDLQCLWSVQSEIPRSAKTTKQPGGDQGTAPGGRGRCQGSATFAQGYSACRPSTRHSAWSSRKLRSQAPCAGGSSSTGPRPSPARRPVARPRMQTRRRMHLQSDPLHLHHRDLRAGTTAVPAHAPGVASIGRPQRCTCRSATKPKKRRSPAMRAQGPRAQGRMPTPKAHTATTARIPARIQRSPQRKCSPKQKRASSSRSTTAG